MNIFSHSTQFIYFSFVLLALCSLYMPLKLYFKGFKSVNMYIYESIPSIFTTLGILGTFIGIYIGLQDFNVNNIGESIPNLLLGLKSAFETSIIGIISSIISSKYSKFFLHKAEIKYHCETNVDTDKSLLQNINFSLSQLVNQQQDMQKYFKETFVLSIDNHFGKLNHCLENIINNGKESIDIQNTALSESIQNRDLFIEKLESFMDIIAKNNTDVLVGMMKNATEIFNSQMRALLDKLVQENFSELNRSVERLNDWQIENKEMISSLTNQFSMVSKNLAITEISLQNITEYTEKLINDDGKLVHLINTLKTVMIDDEHFKDITTKLTHSVNLIKENTEAFDNTTNKLNNWVKQQMTFSDSVGLLMTRLEEIERIKDINDVFWNDTKKQLNEGVGILTKASETLNMEIENINAEFYERLNSTLQNLDVCIQRMVEEYRK